MERVSLVYRAPDALLPPLRGGAVRASCQYFRSGPAIDSADEVVDHQRRQVVCFLVGFCFWLLDPHLLDRSSYRRGQLDVATEWGGGPKKIDHAISLYRSINPCRSINYPAPEMGE